MKLEIEKKLSKWDRPSLIEKRRLKKNIANFQINGKEKSLQFLKRYVAAKILK